MFQHLKIFILVPLTSLFQSIFYFLRRAIFLLNSIFFAKINLKFFTNFLMMLLNLKKFIKDFYGNL